MKTKFPLFFLCIAIVGASCNPSQNNDDSIGAHNNEPGKFDQTYLIERDTAIFYGELIYVPIYSEIFYGDAGKTIELAATLSIHNTDLENLIVIKNINYHDTKGNLIKKFLRQPISLSPLETNNITIDEQDKTGGIGANFIVEWYCQYHVSSPIIEAIMITTQMNQGISFTTTGKIIKKFGTSTPDQ
ncbi:MAG: DUF3124 domain-containing protein [Bacteroidales bacterium]|nr:DUF3124 domain-containing protein [Bacteroidales bacterium]